ncbi:Mss4-like protein [Xylogone sp. PMI_703]|nr:Mss4-like protein [Xylogone sp. PMI_703]
MSTNTVPVLTGGCYCGHVTYESSSLPTHLTNCYCRTCRKLSGAPFITFGSFETSSITWTSGRDSLKQTSYSDVARRTHCPSCGSQISMEYYCEPEVIGIAMGSVNEESVKGDLGKAKTHIFVEEGEKAGWYEILDNLPQYPRFPEEFQERIDAWRRSQSSSGPNQ